MDEVRDQVAVREHGGLRGAGRPAGVLEQRQVVTADGRRRNRRRFVPVARLPEQVVPVRDVAGYVAAQRLPLLARCRHRKSEQQLGTEGQVPDHVQTTTWVSGVPGRAASTRSTALCHTIANRAPESMSRWCSSSAVYVGFSSTATAPSRSTAWYAMTWELQLGSTRPTRSPGPTPRRRRATIARRICSSACA